MSDLNEQATLPAEGNESATPEAENPVELEAEASEQSEAEAADTTEPADDSETESSKDKPESEVERVRKQMQRRIDRLTAKRIAAEQKAAALEAAAEERRRASESEDETPQRQAEDPREIARQMRIAEQTAESVSRMAKDARAKFRDFEPVIQDLLEETGPLIDQRTGHPSPLMEAVLDSDKASEILYHLGKNPDVAAELVGLSPAKLGRRIERIESELRAKAAPPKPSGAARPLAPVKPSPPPVVDPTKLTDAQWREMRLKAKLA